MMSYTKRLHRYLLLVGCVLAYLWSIFTKQIGVDLPKEKEADKEDNDEFYLKVHHAMLEVEVVSGDLICPETGRKFPIKNGIPNMLCNEEEVSKK